MNEKEVKWYWQIVTDCLIDFHGRSETEAVELISGLQQKMDQAPQEVRAIMFHECPFTLACDLTGQQLQMHEHSERLSQIYQKWDGVQSGCEQCGEIKALILEWAFKKGHNSCWYYPEIFKKIAAILDIDLPNNLPGIPEEEFEQGCDKWREEKYRNASGETHTQED